MTVSTSPLAASQPKGLGLAVLTAATFATSGTFATSLLDAGWSPAAAVTVRLLIAALALTVPAILAMRGRWSRMAGTSRVMLSYGVIAVAGSQLCYFNAVEHLSVGIALLLEYLGIVLIVAWQWLRHGQRPQPLTIAGVVVVMAGLVLVLNLSGHQHLNLIGVLWGLGAAVGLATFFVIAADSDDGLPPLAMAWGGMAIGAVALLLLGLVHGVAMNVSTHPVLFLHHRTSWVVPVLGLALIAGAIPYATGIPAAQLLGAKLASFVGLSEVLFAAVFAWLGLGQHLDGLQIIGGVFVLIGIGVVRADEPQQLAEPDPELDVELNPRSPSYV
jgi:drug/metabolite transporter (DMT)-like permease